MKKYFLIACLFMVATILTSCRTREQRVIDRLEKLTEKIQKNGAKWDAEQWADAFEDIQDIHYDIEECDFNEEQTKRLGRVEGALVATIAAKGSKALGTNVDEFLQSAENFMSGFEQGFMENSNVDEIKNLGIDLDELQKSIDKDN